ncbi:MAG: VOC family protein [Clostridiales Family XIII bacterium]|jgi:PhnB protein|nr:VOC family protein [Clostridiales Family XIII bacterium]
MSFDVFLNFDGDCREALGFYAGVFGAEPSHVTPYDSAPGTSVPQADAGRVMYASLPVFGHNVMFSDCPSGSVHVKGTNICLTLGCADKEEIDRLFAALSEGGQVVTPLGRTFFSERYGMVTDRFSVTWQLSLTEF